LFSVLSLVGLALFALFVLPMVWSLFSALATGITDITSLFYPTTVVSALSGLVSLRAPSLSLPGFPKLGAVSLFASRKSDEHVLNWAQFDDAAAASASPPPPPQQVAWSASFSRDSSSADGQVGFV
jgi:hypothetical protein